MLYTYKSINDLQPGPERQNFYGKIMFIAKKDDKLILLLKDETKSVFLTVKTIDGQELKFETRQVVRVHRCSVGANPNRKIVLARIGVFGCHLVVWPQFGNADEPTVITSKTWTKSKEDHERLETLSQLGRTAGETDANEIARKLIEHREKAKANRQVAGWWNGLKLNLKQTLARDARELFFKYNQIGSVVESTKSRFFIDNSFFNSKNDDEFPQLVLLCSHCFAKSKKVEYKSDVSSLDCRDCGKPATGLKVAVRVRILSEIRDIFFTIPVDIINSEIVGSIVNCFDSDMEVKEREENIKQFRQMLQKTLWDASFTGVKGVVASRSTESKFIEIFLVEAKVLSLVK